MNIFLSILLCLGLAYHGIRKKSLSWDGALAAVLIGLLIFPHPDIAFTVLLLAFYLTGSAFTKVL
jgi:uncharacterized membrane protein